MLEVTKENYIVPKGEEGTYHCRIEQTQFNPRNGKRVSRPRIQKFEAKMFPSILRNLKLQGWDVEVLYDPTEFLKEQEAKRLEMQELTYKQRQEMEAKRKAAEREALKEDILAELRRDGLIADPNEGKEKTKKEPKADGSKKTK